MSGTKRLAVRILRESTGQVYSEVLDLTAEPQPWNGQLPTVVFDRQRGNGPVSDISTIRRRAEILAQLIGAELQEDLTWPCVATRRLVCRCPECIKAGRA